MRRAKTVRLCLLPLLLFLAAGAAIAGETEERDVALVMFEPMSARLSGAVPCTLAVTYDGTEASVGLRGFHIEVTYDDAYVFVDSLDVHVTEGNFLSDVGGTAFYVLPVDSNTFIVDCAILGETWGGIGAGELFHIVFKGQPAGDGPSVVEITDLKLRDPDNFGILGSAGFAVLTLDNTHPGVPVLDPEPEFTQGTSNYLSWNIPTDAVGFCVQASETPTFEVIVSTSGCTPYNYHDFIGLTDGQIYYYRVQCRDDLWNVSEFSTTEFSTQDDTPPDTEAGPLDSYCNTISFDVPFTEYDATSGTAYVELYYQKNSGGYVQYGTTFTTSPISFIAPGEGTYDLYTVGTDNVDNVESAPVSADCSTEVDLTPPAPPIDLVALPGHNSISLTWNVPVARDAPVEGTLLVRRPWSIFAYPEYDDFGPPFGYPSHPADGIVVTFVPGTGAQSHVDNSFTDESRNVHYYTAFTRDEAGNYSMAASTAQDRSTSYWLADVADISWPPAAYDGLVNFYDKLPYSIAYYTTEGDPLYDAELDVGPTDDFSRMGIPLTDNAIDFEDLMILAMNYGRVSPARTLKEGTPVASTGDRVLVSLDCADGSLVLGEAIEIVLMMSEGDGSAKGVSSLTSFDTNALELVSVTPGDVLDEAGETFFYGAEVEPGRVRVDAAALGAAAVMPTTGRLATLSFRVRACAATKMDIEEIVVRSVDNGEIPCDGRGVNVGGDDDLPVTWGLAQNVPNPFNPRTTIAFDMPEAGHVTLRIHDVSGREVRALVDEPRDAGTHRVLWDGRDSGGTEASSGVYFYVLEGTGTRLVQKMLLIR